MSALASPRLRGASARAAAMVAFAAVGLAAIASVGASATAAHADAHNFVIVTGAVVAAQSDGSLAEAVRLDPPVATLPLVEEPAAEAPATPDTVATTPTAAVVPAVVNRSNCRHDLADPVMTITIPDISYSCPVYAGGQAMLNSGAATLITDPAISQVLADHPGGAGLLWVAGHRSSHGGAFAAVPNLANGALITVSDGTYTATYRVVSRLYVTIRNDRVVDATGNATGEATLDSIIRPDHGGNKAARLLLQTCDGDTHRWMIYADLVG